jgi:signal transduction histidine kinase
VLSVLMLPGLLSGGFSQEQPLTTVAQVKALTREDAARRLPVHLRGVVTHIENYAHLAFLQDETGGVYFSPGHFFGGDYVTAEQGEVLEIRGWTSPGRFAPNVAGEGEKGVAWRRVGRRELPEPKRLLPHELANPVNHSEWVEMTGVVREAREIAFGSDGYYRIQFRLSTIDGEFNAFVPKDAEASFDPGPWLGAAVRVRGVYGSIFNEQRQLTGMQLWVQRIEQIQIEDAGRQSFAKLPVRTIDSLMQFEPSVGVRARLRGVVTWQEPQRGFFLRDVSGAVWVQTPQEGLLPPGVEAEVVGFPSTQHGVPVVRDAVFMAEGISRRIAPKAVAPEEAVEGEFHGELIRLQARVVDRMGAPGAESYSMQAGGVTFQARFAPGIATPVPGPLRETWLELTGVCVNQFRGGSDPEGTGVSLPRAVSFELLLRSAEDVRVVKTPPWWTPERVAWLIGGSGAALALALLWVGALRRQVARQTAIISGQAAREAQTEERARIARELHDTLEQDLTGVQMQLDAVEDNLLAQPEAAMETLHSARALLRHTREEARRTLWDLRSAVLERGGLPEALRSLFATLHATEPAVIEVRSEGTTRRLSGSMENHLLRIAQEAVHNALAHGHATRIEVAVEFRADAVVLRVIDNGIGFDPEQPPGPEGGHFGLVGMRERANRIGAQFSIRSRIGGGTRIEAHVAVQAAKAHPVAAS